jgi:hypothetical protein
LSDEVSETIETRFISGIPKPLADAISDDVAFGGSGSLVFSSEPLKFFSVSISNLTVRLGINLFSLCLIGLECGELGSFKLSGSLTDERFSSKVGLGLFLGFSLFLSLGIHLSLSLSFSLGGSVFLGNGGTL